MKTKAVESLPCVCGKGALEVEVAIFGTWRVDMLLAPCPECHRNDIGEARQARVTETAKPPSESSGSSD